MFQHQHNPQHQQLTRGIALLATATLTAIALGAGAGPAAARQDPGPGHDTRRSRRRVLPHPRRHAVHAVRQQHRKRGAGTCLGSRVVSRPGTTTVAPDPYGSGATAGLPFG